MIRVAWTGSGVPLRAADWEVRPVSIPQALRIIEVEHYARGASNTATYLHGLFLQGADENGCVGVAWWIPPTKAAAQATYPADWRGVLALSRLAIAPVVPPNAATFLIAASMRLIDRVRWPALVSYADAWRGHTGAIYRAANWTFVGTTKPERVFVLANRMVARKAGPKTRTTAEMEALGAVCVGAFPKQKFVHIRAPAAAT